MVEVGRGANVVVLEGLHVAVMHRRYLAEQEIARIQIVETGSHYEVATVDEISYGDEVELRVGAILAPNQTLGARRQIDGGYRATRTGHEQDSRKIGPGIRDMAGKEAIGIENRHSVAQTVPRTLVDEDGLVKNGRSGDCLLYTSDAADE